MRWLFAMALIVSMGEASSVNVTTKYGKTGGIVGPLNTTSDLINGRQVCPADPTPGCDFADDPGFNNNGTVDDPTDDYYTGDLLVRTNDNFQAIAGWTWNGNPGGAEEVATITGTLPVAPDGNKYYEWTEIPGSCNPDHSSISADKQTIVCERKDFDKNDVGTFSEDLIFNVRVLGGTSNGTQPGDIKFKVEAPNAAAKEDTTDGHSLKVTASPRWNLDKAFGAYSIRSGQKVTINGQEETGYIIDYRILIETDEVNGETDNTYSLLGNESLGDDATITFTDDLSEIAPHATLLDCRTTGRAYSDTVRDGYVGSNLPITCIGDGCIRGSQYPERHIPQPKGEQTPTCTQTGSTVDVKIEHVDATLNHYPTKDYYGRDLPVNRAIASILTLSVFVPLDDVKAGDNGTVDCDGYGIGDPNCDDGELHTKNTAKDFDPVTPSGNHNFAGQGESEKDNYRNYTLYYSAGSFDKYYWGEKNSVWNAPAGIAHSREGDGFVGKGYEWSSRLYAANTGGIDQTENSFCDVIDANYMEIIKYSERTNYTDTRYAHEDDLPFIVYASNTDKGDPDNHMYRGGKISDYYDIEYAADYEDPSFLPSNNGDRQDENVDEKIKAECNAPADKWYPTIDEARAAGGAVTKIRWKLKPNMVMVPGQREYWMLLHRVRANRLDNNQPLQNGAMMVNYGTHKFDGNQGTWSTVSYIPHGLDANGQPENFVNGTGDRIFFTGPKVRIKKHENRTSASPGDEVTYTLEMSLTDDVNSNGLTEHVTVTDVLPKDFNYQQGSVSPEEFGEPILGTCADVSDITSASAPCVDGENQVLIWDLGERGVNAPNIPDLNYTVRIGAAANVGNNLNVVKIEAPSDASPVSQRKADIGLSIDIPASINIVKSTEENSDYPSKRERTTDPKDIFFRMDVRNGKSGEITDLDIIDILPFIGDGDDGAIQFNDLALKRKVPTNYHGTLAFHEADFGQHPGSSTECDYNQLDYYYTNADPKTINIAPTVGDANDVNSNSSIWCQGDANGPNGCTIPSTGFTFTDNSEVTAVRVRGPRMEAQAICQFRVHVTVDDNLMGDNYSNSAGASATGITLPVLSNSVAVPIVGSSLGDYVWYDKNKDGIQDNDEHGISGVKVDLLDASGNPVNDPTTGQPYVVTTDANGKYLFTNLSHGNYQVRFEIPSGYKASPANQGDDSENSDGDSNGIAQVSLGVDETNPNVDMGINTPIISGHVFDDGNGNGNVDGTLISQADGTQLYVTLLDENGTVLASAPVANDGAYSFDGDDGVRANSNYSVVLSTAQNTTTSALPANWNNADGEQPNNSGNGTDGTPDGVMSVAVGTSDSVNNDFGINKKPVANDETKPAVLNPGGSTQVAVPALDYSDQEDGTPSTITITTLPDPATGVLYYDGTPVTAGQTINNFDPSKLTVDPTDGDQTVVFKYTVTDAAGVTSDEATVTLPFTGLGLSGHVFDDGNGNGNIDGTPISKPDGIQLYANLVDANGTVLAVQPVAADGTYAFGGTDGVTANTTYGVVLSTTQGTVGQSAPAAALPANWNNADGEQPNNSGNGTDGTPDGVMSVAVGTSDSVNDDFGINKKPVANDTSRPAQLNPGQDTQVQVPELNVTDREDGKPKTITIRDLPSNATLYYNGQPVTAGQVITNYDPSKLTVDPIDGDQTVVFHYTTTDAVGVESDPATVTLSFNGLGLSGTLYDDGNGNTNNKVDGTPISKPDGQPLYVNLIREDGKVIASKLLADDGTYQFLGSDGVTANTEYDIVLSTIKGTPDDPAPAAQLPVNWNNTGEHLNNEGDGNDGNNDGKIHVALGTSGIPKIDFGINKKPVARDRTEAAQPNPSGAKQYPVPALPVSDNEDGTPTTITIKTLPDPATGVFYYDGQPVTAGQVIENFDPDKLTVDPTDGNPVMVFTYTTTDAAGIESDPAKVTMPFLGEMHLGDTVWMDDDGNGIQDLGEAGVSGVEVRLLDENGTVVQTVTTDAEGHYDFTIQIPGKYMVEFDSDYYYTTKGAGSADNDSNVGGLSNRTEPVELGWGERDMTIDAGITPTAHIGDYFWIDENKNGIQDPGEPPVAGGVVELYDADGNPVSDVHGNHSVTTDSNGKYGFDVEPGQTYKLHFIIPKNLQEDGYVFTPSNAGSDTGDSDADGSGFTVTVTPHAGQNIVTLDAGINCGCDRKQVSNDSGGGSAMGVISGLLMIFLSAGLGLWMIRREESEVLG
ncbi:conserved repeat domain protein [Nitratifractor salsuginis DSM 16511]|uniref:Conserved repeat domain protein n=2 Tax=Nitratifractor salsuginis TaxID=269261 RepID=E6WZT3_NITSE|nr:conserved repeat domain protein [Nitratifractor salsuginis DSM 16511]